MTINRIDVHELKKRYDESPDLCLIDVREQDEWDALHIPGASHIPKDELVSVIDGRIPNRDHPIYMYCRGGTRSLNAAKNLVELGYQHVYSIDGGIVDWAESGFPVQP